MRISDLPTPIHVGTTVESHISFLVQPSHGVGVISTVELYYRMAAGDFGAHAELLAPMALAPAELIPPNFRVIRSSAAPGEVAVLCRSESAALLVCAYDTSTKVHLFAQERGELADLWAQISRLVRSRFVDQTDVAVTTWHYSEFGPASAVIRAHSRLWADIRTNYPSPTIAGLDLLMALRGAPDGGRLILWHGPPGTGKTSAVTTLMSAWSSWCDPHLITDPESLFGRPNYLLKVLNSASTAVVPTGLPSLEEPPAKRWKIVVCEDADDYLRSDARQRSGPALGRLLNATDGILGRDSRAMILLTTNDDVTRLHPALTRPGRCFAAVQFPPMSRAEAANWCPPGVVPPSHPATLAELYALTRDGRSVDEPETLGAYL